MSLDIEKILKQARTLAEAGEGEKSRLLLLGILKEEPDNKAALLILGGAYFTADKLQEAEMVFERLILMEPGTGEFSIALFNTLWKQGRYEEAMEEIKRFMGTADRVKEKKTIDQYIAISEKMTDYKE